MDTAFGLELKVTVVLQVDQLGPVLAQDDEVDVLTIGVTVKFKRQVGQVVHVDLGLIGPRRHRVLPVGSHFNLVGGLFELKVLDKLDPVLVVKIVFEGPFPLLGNPVGKQPRNIGP